MLLAQQPNKRFATVEELGALAVFLASEAAARSPARRCRSTAAGPRTERDRGAADGQCPTCKVTRRSASESESAASRRASPARSADRVVLVFQGGGALGAYQAGVYQALHEAGIEPDWIIGTSIGAINASLIAGNEPENRLDRAARNSGGAWRTHRPSDALVALAAAVRHAA